MRFKLDENLGARAQDLFHAAGHNVETVHGESLGGASDYKIYAACCYEQRRLVTLDLDFADVTRFNPAQAAGIAVLRPPHNRSLALLQHIIGQLLRQVERQTITGQLWILEVGRLRIHEAIEPE